MRVATSADEVDAAGQAAEVDAVGTNVAFHVADGLAHDVVDRDFSVLAERDVEAVDSRIGIDAHLGVVHHGGLFDVVVAEQVVQVEGEALVVAVELVGVAAAADDEGFTLSMTVKRKLEGKKRPELVEEQERFKYSDIKYTKNIIKI